jgi:hypothetical protein
MITVEELKSRRLFGIDKIMKDIESKVIAADDAGYEAIEYTVVSNTDYEIAAIVYRLKESGYHVKRHKAVHFRDPVDFIVVSWTEQSE